MIGNKDFSEIDFRMDFVSVTIVNIRRSPLVIGLGLITEYHIRRDKLRIVLIGLTQQDGKAMFARMLS